MNSAFIIKGGKPLFGTINVRGSKNAATPIIAATLLSNKKYRIANLPLVDDVYNMLEMMERMGANIRWIKKRTIEIENKSIKPSKIDGSAVKKLRSSILFAGPLLARFGKVKMPYPGGCSIGARPIQTHLKAFEDLGARVWASKKYFFIDLPRTKKIPRALTLNEFSVTATENILMFLASRRSTIQVKIAASEPHVQDLINFLNKSGAKINGGGTPFVKIRGSGNLKGVFHKIIPDYIEAGTFIFAALVAGGRVRICNAPVSHLDLVIKKLVLYGADIRALEGKNIIEVARGKKMFIEKIQAMPYPGIPTDLQPAFGVLATQAHGNTLLHDPMYEGRLNHLRGLNKMGARIEIHDPHRASIMGPTKLRAGTLKVQDLRGGAAFLIAALAARGTTVLTNIEHIERGYEAIDGRLRALGANIRRI